MLHDLPDLFGQAQERLPREFYQLWFRQAHWQFRQLFGLLPVQRAGDGFWAPRPLRGHRRSDLRLVMAVRSGDPWADGFGLPAWIRTDDRGLPLPEMAPRLLGSRALFGPDIIDLLVVDFDLVKPPLRLTGAAPALGGALDPHHWSDRAEEPVLVVENVQRWLARALDGACLPLGDASEQASLLRSFHGGLLAESVARGQALQAQMRRAPPRLPALYVEAAA